MILLATIDETPLRLTSLEELYLSSNLFRNNTISFLEGLPNLKSLDMYNNTLQGSLDIKGLSNLTNLKKLDLSDNQIESFQSFKDGDRKLKLIHLEEVYLDRNLFNSSVFAFLNKLSNLKYLSISGNQLKGSIDMKEIKGLRNLEIVYLDHVFTDGSIPLQNLVEAFSSVKSFYLQESYLNMTRTTQELNVSSNGEELYFDFSSLNTNILQGIGVFSSLKTLSSCGLIGSLPNEGWCDLWNLEVLDETIFKFHCHSHHLQTFQTSKFF
ncbi:hypothetical protein GOBAR_AA31018 [Gossypium barbadense]|uniref:Leucine-rich repeat-containing N-terminal plant-type domain-containing protein n=1 Tax=Gossypium barbadense TaxID=3634 RepID=A0A2P5WF13_GOSBA|nr:hypothetical protein GOBAR_AA31018 [Gossypium barbadense]